MIYVFIRENRCSYLCCVPSCPVGYVPRFLSVSSGEWRDWPGPSPLSCAQFVMFPYSSSRFEVKLLLVVINHLEVEIYGGDETWCHVGLTLTLGDIRFKLRLLLSLTRQKLKDRDVEVFMCSRLPGFLLIRAVFRWRWMWGTGGMKLTGAAFGDKSFPSSTLWKAKVMVWPGIKLETRHKSSATDCHF
jgi:hypothetical protein